MKKLSFYSKTSIFVFSILFTGVAGSLMMSYNLKKAGENKLIFPLILVSIIVNGIMRIGANYFFSTYHIFNLNKTIGWAWDITNFFWWRGYFAAYFIPNGILGLILVFPFWNKYLIEFPEYKRETPRIPLLIGFVLIAAAISIHGLRLP